MTDEVTLASVVGQNLRRLRVAADLTQPELADLFRGDDERVADLALWSTDTVADVETGRRDVSFEEMVHLAAFFDVGVVEFLEGDEDHLVGFGVIGPRHHLELARMFVQRSSTAEQELTEEELAQNLRDRFASDAHRVVLDHNPTAGIAERLEVTPTVLNRAARSLWGHSVKDEYYERFEGRVAPNREMSRRGLAIVRGHIVRHLVKELETQLSTKKGRKK